MAWELFHCTSALLQELGLARLLEKEEIQAGVAAANETGDREQASKSSPGALALLALGSVPCPVSDIWIGQGKLLSPSKPNKGLDPSYSLPSAPPGGHIK